MGLTGLCTMRFSRLGDTRWFLLEICHIRERRKKTDQIKMELKEFFVRGDLSCDGELSFEELSIAAAPEGAALAQRVWHRFSDTQVFFELLDHDGNGSIMHEG